MDTKKTILIVEDEETLAFSLKRKLEASGFTAELALDGEEAIQRVNELKPDLILLDLILPKIGGVEVLKKIKAVEETKNIPVIVLTNLSSGETIAEVVEAGGTDYIVKANTSLDEIVEAVNKKLSYEA